MLLLFSFTFFRRLCKSLLIRCKKKKISCVCVCACVCVRAKTISDTLTEKMRELNVIISGVVEDESED